MALTNYHVVLTSLVNIRCKGSNRTVANLFIQKGPQIQPNKFPVDFQDNSNKVPVDFYIEQA